MTRSFLVFPLATVVASAVLAACNGSNSSTSDGGSANSSSSSASPGGTSTAGAGSTGGAASTSVTGTSSSGAGVTSTASGSGAASSTASTSASASSSAATGSSSTTSGEGGVGSGTGFFSDGFESDAVNSQPAGFGNLVDYIQNGANPNSSGDLATVDTTHVHTGAHAVHFHVAAGDNPSFLTYPLPSGTNTLYMRAWVYLSRQLGDNAASDMDNHETLFALNGTPGGVGNEVRFGAIKGTVGVNESSTDNISPLQAMWNGPPSIPATTWVCIEVAFLGAPAQNEFHAWMNDADLLDITAPNQWQNGAMPMNWLNGKFVEADFGWQSFSGFGADVWVDDLVLGNARIGCE
jgi:hypothetical protein